MLQAIKDLLISWNVANSERVKLQHAYLVVCVLGLVVAGLVGLLNYDASRTILRVCFAGFGIFVVNAVAWALLSSLVLSRFTVRRTTTRTSTK